jgi:hypothetical protein
MNKYMCLLLATCSLQAWPSGHIQGSGFGASAKTSQPDFKLLDEMNLHTLTYDPLDKYASLKEQGASVLRAFSLDWLAQTVSEGPGWTSQTRTKSPARFILGSRGFNLDRVYIGAEFKSNRIHARVALDSEGGYARSTYYLSKESGVFCQVRQKDDETSFHVSYQRRF